MISKVDLKPFKKAQLFLTYVYKNGINIYTLNATVVGGYKITLGKIAIGDSLSGGHPLCHVLFEGYTMYGQKMIETRARVGGYERKFNAFKQAMMEAGAVVSAL